MKMFRNLKKKNKFKLNFKSSIVLFTSGYNLERYLNSLCEKNIHFLSIEKINAKNAKIEIEPVYEKEVENFLKGKNIEIKDKKYNGRAKINKFFLSRFGILIGLFFAFCFCVVSSNYVWQIKVMGNETRSTDEIVSVLNENGVSIFNALNCKTNEEIERIMLDNFSEISMVSVVKKGTTIIINLKEKLLNDEHENVGKYSPLVATNDGIVTSIELIQGTVLVKVGDTIRVGDQLVAPYVIDSSGKQISIEPKADIYADVWLAGESVHYDTKNVVERTGNYKVERKITFLDKEIFSEKVDILYTNYEKETTETYLSETLLPVKYSTTFYYETEIKIIEQSFSEVSDIKIAEAEKLAKIRIRESEIIKFENYTMTNSYGKTVVSYSITVNRKIT